MAEERPSFGYNPLDPRDRIERGRERAAWFRRSDMMGAVALAMVVFVALAILRQEWALAYLVAAMVLPLLISLGLILANAFAQRSGRADPLPSRPGPAMLVAVSTALFFLLADPLSPAGIAGAVAAVGLVWRVFSRHKPGEEGHD